MKEFLINEKPLIGSFLLTFTCSLYFFYFPSSPKNEKIVSSSHVLMEKPSEYTQGGDMPYQIIDIKVIDSKITFNIRDCSYTVCDIGILGLSAGDSIKIQSYDTGVLFKSASIVSLKSKGKEYISFEKVDNCESNGWKSLMYLSIMVLVIILVGFFWKLYESKIGF